MKKQEELEKKVNRFTKIAAGILLLAVVAGFLVMVLTSRRKAEPEPTPTPAPTQAVQPTPAAAVHTALCLRTGADGRRRIHAVRGGQAC